MIFIQDITNRKKIEHNTMSSVIISERCVFPLSKGTVKSTQQHHDLINEDPQITSNAR